MAGQYLLRERIGEGGMGVVYRAEQLALARPVAVKLLHPQLSTIPDLLHRFRREAQAASRVEHPNAVAVLDFGLTDHGTPFLVMEYVRGGTLAELLQTAGSLPQARALALVRQILAVLEVASLVGVVHADLKADNVLVQQLASGADLVKVVDFGLARIRDAGEPWVGGASISGTPEYMAPEVIAGHPPTAASDLYAVGVILYELLTGATPFAGGSALEILERQVHDLVVPPSLRCPGRPIAGAVERACLRALAKRPDQRFASAAAFAAALEAAAAPLDAGDPVPVEITSDQPTRPTDVGTAIPIDQLRAGIGVAIRRGDVDAMAACYLALAQTMSGLRREAAAIAELEEAVDLVTAGEGPSAETAPRSLWRLLVALARLHERAGDAARGRRLAAVAVRHTRH